MSLVETAIWPEIRHYLSVEEYDKDGGHLDPRIRIMFRGVPVALSHRAQAQTMMCVTCGRSIFPLRRQEGSGHESLYYAATCPIGQRIACSRSGPARDEYDRFKAIWATRAMTAKPQLTLF